MRNIKFRKLSLFIVIAWTLYAIAYSFLGEKIPLYGGFGWDGNVYGNAALDLPGFLESGSYQRTHVERVLPSALVFGIMKMLHIQPTHGHVIQVFEWMNMVMVIGCSLLWFRICKMEGIGDAWRFVGIVLLILGFPAMKFFLYYPVLTDVSALFLGFLALYGYLSKNMILLFIVVAASTFTWPVAALTVPLLTLFGRSDELTDAVPSRSNRVLLLLLSVLSAMFVVYFLVVRDHLNEEYPPFTFLASVRFVYLNVVAGLLFLILFIYYTFSFLTRLISRKNVVHCLSRLNLVNLFICFGLLAGAKYVLHFFPQATYISLTWYLINLFTLPALQPGGNMVHLIAFFGPAVWLTVFGWKRISGGINRFGTGFVLFCVANLIQCLDFESRHLVFFFPFIIFMTCYFLNQIELTPINAVVLTGLSLLFSRAWFRINTDEFLISIEHSIIGSDPVHQRYLAHTGMFTSYQGYLVLLAAVTLAGVLIYLLFRSRLATLNALPGSLAGEIAQD